MKRRSEHLLVTGAENLDALNQITHRHAGVNRLIIVRMRERRHQRYQPAVAPPNNAHAPGIDLRVPRQHERPGGMNVLDFQPTIINQPPKLAPVTTAAPIVWRD